MSGGRHGWRRVGGERSRGADTLGSVVFFFHLAASRYRLGIDLAQ